MTPQFPTTVLQQEMFFVLTEDCQMESGGYQHISNMFQKGMLAKVPEGTTWTCSDGMWIPEKIYVDCHKPIILCGSENCGGSMPPLLGPFHSAILEMDVYLVSVIPSTNKNPEDWSIQGQACGRLHQRSIKREKATDLPEFELLRTQKVLLGIYGGECYTIVTPTIIAHPTK